MAFTNAFQGGQQFAVLLDQRKQQREAEANRQLGIQALAEEFGPTALAPAERASTFATERADRAQVNTQAQRKTANELALRQQEGVEGERVKIGERAERVQTGIEEQRDVLNQQAADKAARDAAAKAEVDQAKALGNFVAFAKAGMKAGKTIEEITATQSKALTALGIPVEQQTLFTDAVNADPKVLDQFAAAFKNTAKGNDVFTVRTFKRPDGTLVDVKIRRDGTEEEVTAGTPASAALAGGRLDVQKQRLKIAAETNRLKTPEVQADKALSVEASKQAVKTLNEDFPTATSAALNIVNADRMLELLDDEGIRTGSFANVRQGGARFLRDNFGIDLGQIGSTDEFFALSGINVAQQIQAFGSGTGLSDADREFARKIVGGEIVADEQAIRRLLEVQRRISVRTVNDYNKRLGLVSGTTTAATRARLPQNVPLPGGEESLDDILARFPATGG